MADGYPMSHKEQLEERAMRVKEIHAIVAVIECRSEGVHEVATLSGATALKLIEKVVGLVEEIK